MEPDMFKGEKNYRILIILKLLNLLLPPEYNISGYYNCYDQFEYAFILSSINIVELKISIMKRIELIKDGTIYKLNIPDDLTRDIYSQISSSVGYTENYDYGGKYMNCNEIRNILYTDFDNNHITNSFDCNADVIPNCSDMMLHKKYMKYKLKYLALRDKLS